ncbi:MAG: FHA domain-containing protein [Kiritimatiellae bacterium]|nr:FHA domain-containing protein [Kiritimatiellia bacterium]
MFKLTVEKGEAAGKVYELKPGENTIGRSRSTAVHIASPDVSGVHARIRIAGGSAFLENLSQFGTSVNGAPVTGEVVLADGQRLGLGKNTVLLFSQDTAKLQEAVTGAGLDPAAADDGERTMAATVGATRAPVTQAATRAGDADGLEMTAAFVPPDPDMEEEEGATHAMQTRGATPEEIEMLRSNEQKRARRKIMTIVAVAVPLLLLTIILRPKPLPPETEIEWARDESGEYLDAFEPALSGGVKDGGYDVMYPGNKSFKKSVVGGGFVLEGRMGRKLDVPMRVVLQEEHDIRLAGMSRAEMVDDWIEQVSASGGRWNFERPSPVVAFFGKRNGVPYTRVTYLRDGGGSWFGMACVVRHGCRRITLCAEVPVTERVRAESMLATKMLAVSEQFEYSHWEHNPVIPAFPENEVLSQVSKELDRIAPATWVALENQLTGVLTKASLASNTEGVSEAQRLLMKLRERQTLWFNSQQLAFDSALMQGSNARAVKIAEFTKAVFSNMEDQRYFTVRKWKVY